MAYLRDNPLVALAAVCSVLAVMTMLMTSLLSLRFLRRLRAEAGSFWSTQFGTASVGTLRLLRITPAKVAAMSAEDDVLRICDAYAGPFRVWRVLSFVMIGATIIALVAAGSMGI